MSKLHTPDTIAGEDNLTDKRTNEPRDCPVCGEPNTDLGNHLRHNCDGAGN